MLIISCSLGEVIRIGDDMKVTIREVNEFQQVRFGIKSLLGTPIHRKEEYLNILDKTQRTPFYKKTCMIYRRNTIPM